MEPTLPEGAGYAVVIGLSGFFALLLNSLTSLQNRYFENNTHLADEFSAASRNVKTGLIVAGVCSSWTWSLTLLQPSTNAYLMGISGGYWYMVGGLVQVAIFSAVAAKVKANAGRTTTFPEIAYFRWGTAGHLAFLWCGLICNAIVSACILVGGSTVVHAVTGMSIYASLCLLPFGIAAYIFLGGLRATFISDVTHTLFLLVFLLVFLFTVYATSDKIGSPSKMVDLLTATGHEYPISNNYHGSYLTFRSQQGAILAVHSTITGFGLIFCDQAYWSRAVAARPELTAKAYVLGGVAWSAIPFSMSLSLGLAARALSQYSDYNIPSEDDINSGLAAVIAASYLLGKGGSVIILLMNFLSVTSALSGELIATSTLISYDIYKHYFNPDATAEQVVKVSQIAVFGWAAFSAMLGCVFAKIGISMSWLFYFLGVTSSAGVFPIALSFAWKDLNKFGAIGGSIGGTGIALIVWLVMAKKYQGEITVDTLSEQWVSFTATTTALISGGVIAVVSSLIKPANFNWNITRVKSILKEVTEDFNINNVNNNNKGVIDETVNVSDNAKESDISSGSNKDHENIVSVDEFGVPPADYIPSPDEYHGIDIVLLEKIFKKYGLISIIITLIVGFIFPVPLSAVPYIWSPKFLGAIVGIMIAWTFLSFLLVVILPVYESRRELALVFNSLFKRNKENKQSAAIPT